MEQPGRQTKPHFTQPVRQISIMLMCLALVGFGAYVAYPRVVPVFLANPLFNGFIAFVFAIGVVACFWQVIELVNSVSWIEGFAEERPGRALPRAPRLLAPLAALLRGRGARMQISPPSARSILDSVATRIDEARDITRYIVNLLIFLGLLGTFWGLATTVPAVVDTIRSLAPLNGEGAAEVFARLMNGLEAQLGGMGVAFASSLLGLAGSLIVGLLELFANNGQNRFYRELEEWLSTITRIGFAGAEGEGGGATEGADAGAFAALAGRFAAHVETLEELVGAATAAREEAAREESAALERVCAGVEALSAEVAGLVTALEAERATRAEAAQAHEAALLQALRGLAEGQERLIEAVGRQAEGGGAHVDAESRMRLRSIDVQLLRILEEIAAGRQEALADLRNDLGALTRAVRALGSAPADGAGRGGG